MQLKKGKNHEAISANIKDLVRAGHDPKEATAMALSHSRKFADGGPVVALPNLVSDQTYTGINGDTFASEEEPEKKKTAQEKEDDKVNGALENFEVKSQYAKGGQVSDDDEAEPGDDDMGYRSPAELMAESVDSRGPMNPHEQSERMSFAKALAKKAFMSGNEMDEGFAMGGLVQGDDEPLGAKPSASMKDSTEEPMSSMPGKPASAGHAPVHISADAMKAIADRKKKRRYEH